MMDVALEPVGAEDFGDLAEALRAYMDELGPYEPEPSEPGPYPYLAFYFGDDDRHAFFVTANGDRAGFVLVRDLGLTLHEVAEFCIYPEFRRTGVGTAAAGLAFGRFPGRWQLSVLRRNADAREFWSRVVPGIDAACILDIPEDPLASLRYRFTCG